MTTETQDWLLRSLEEGQKYIVSRKITGVADDGSESIVLDNPTEANGGTKAYVSFLGAKSSGEADVEVVTGVNIDSSGTSITPTNNLVSDSSTLAGATVEQGGSYSGGNEVQTDYITGSGQGQSKIGGDAEQEVFMVEPGQNFQYRVTNISGSNSEIYVKIVWHEQVE